jgi:hypothetical protein
MKTKRQRIVELVVARMQTIRTANHFETDAGELVQQWMTRPDESELAATASKCALGVFDLPDEVSKESMHSKGATHRLRVQIRIFVTGSDKHTRLRTIIGDVVAAVGSDLLWTDPDTGKSTSRDTEPEQEGLILPEQAMEVAGGAVEFTIVFATAVFDPYQ